MASRDHLTDGVNGDFSNCVEIKEFFLKIINCEPDTPQCFLCFLIRAPGLLEEHVEHCGIERSSEEP